MSRLNLPEDALTSAAEKNAYGSLAFQSPERKEHPLPQLYGTVWMFPTQSISLGQRTPCLSIVFMGKPPTADDGVAHSTSRNGKVKAVTTPIENYL